MQQVRMGVSVKSKRADSRGCLEFYMETLANKLGMQVTST